jgi:hypothetical protein
MVDTSSAETDFGPARCSKSFTKLNNDSRVSKRSNADSSKNLNRAASQQINHSGETATASGRSKRVQQEIKERYLSIGTQTPRPGIAFVCAEYFSQHERSISYHSIAGMK